jgi:hypothetical protein
MLDGLWNFVAWATWSRVFFKKKKSKMAFYSLKKLGRKVLEVDNDVL